MTDTPRVYLARAGQMAACRTLLPDAFPPIGDAPELFVAEAGGVIAGALAMAFVPRGFPILAQVAEPWRRRGIGRALLAAAIAAASGETLALRTWDAVEEASDGTSFLRANGFQVTRRLLVFETDAVRFGRDMSALLSRVLAAGRIQPDAVLVPLADAPMAAVAHLVASELAVAIQEVERNLTLRYDRDLSLAVMRRETPVGAMLCRRDGDLAEIDVNVVAPDHRRGWVNLLMLEAMARRCHESGIARFRFSCEPQVRDTLNLARRSGARALPPRVMLGFPLRPAG